MRFNEKELEKSAIRLFQDAGYTHVTGDQIHREKSDVLIEEDLRAFLTKRYSAKGITENEISSILLNLRSISGYVYTSNKATFNLIANGFTLNREDRTQKDIFIELIDFENPDNNIFKIVNQVEVKGHEVRIPDSIIYVNGLPLVVIEFKSAVKENATIHNAFEQLTVRYKRDIPELFKYNAFVVISDGVNNRYGSPFAPYDFFYAWRKTDDDAPEVDGIPSLFSMIEGLFRKDRLLSVIRNYIYFPDDYNSASPDTNNRESKVVCRYPQFFAAEKLFANIVEHMRPEGDGKGGTYFGATGCGKSFTMLFLTRLLMKSPILRNPTIVVITDRTDLDDQLSKLFEASKKYIGDEAVERVNSRADLSDKLRGRNSGGVYLTTVQKFTEELGLLTDRTNVICISDEAHRSQVNLDQKLTVRDDSVEKRYGFAKHLHDSLPNATYVGFTGTPVDATIEVFGKVVDSYTMAESIKDGITVNLVYDGRAAKITLNEDRLQEIEAYYAKCELEGANEHQIEESQKAVANLDVIIGDPDRLKAVAADFIEHYETRVAEGATVTGKAMFVCTNRFIAYDLYKHIIDMRPDWKEAKIFDTQLTDEEKKEIRPSPKIQLVMTRNQDDPPDLYTLLGTKDDRKELDRQFKQVKSNFKIAIVVDMWLTGFDVPCLDTIYIDKPVQQHTLIQTISRVNRVYEGKDKGVIVDYIGIKNHMDKALHKYTNSQIGQLEGAEKSSEIVKDQLDVLAQMFHGFNSRDFFHGAPKAQLDCLNRAVEYVQRSNELETRFMTAVKRMKKAFNLCAASADISDEERDYIHFYLAVRSVLFKLTKGNAPDITQMNARVRELIAQAIESDGVEPLFETGKHIKEVDIFSEEYLAKILSIPLPNTRVKILQQLLLQSISEFRKVNKIKSIEFADRLKRLIDKYNNRGEDEKYASDVVDEVAEQLIQVLKDMGKERRSFIDLGITYEEKAFYDILKAVADKYKFDYPHDRLIELSSKIKAIVDDKTKYTDWDRREDIKAEFNADLIITLDANGYPPITNDEVFKEVLEQAQNFKKYAG